MAASKTVFVEINGNVYQLPYTMAKRLIRVAQRKFEREHKWAIVAVEKNGRYFLKRDIFCSGWAQLEARRQFIKCGFKVYISNPSALNWYKLDKINAEREKRENEKQQKQATQ